MNFKAFTNFPRWARDLVVIPIIVGVIVAVLTIVLPKLFADDKEITYSIEDPVEIQSLNKQGKASKLSQYSYSIIIWNSGDISIEDLAVRVIFKTENNKFRITKIRHLTNPPIEFGKITTQIPDQFSNGFTYELLNPGDSDKITLITNHEAPI